MEDTITPKQIEPTQENTELGMPGSMEIQGDESFVNPQTASEAETGFGADIKDSAKNSNTTDSNTLQQTPTTKVPEPVIDTIIKDTVKGKNSREQINSKMLTGEANKAITGKTARGFLFGIAAESQRKAG